MAKKLNFEELLKLNDGLYERELLRVHFAKDYIVIDVSTDLAGIELFKLFPVEYLTPSVFSDGICWTVCIPYSDLVIEGYDLSEKEKKQNKNFIDELFERRDALKHEKELLELKKKDIRAWRRAMGYDD